MHPCFILTISFYVYILTEHCMYIAGEQDEWYNDNDVDDNDNDDDDDGHVQYASCNQTIPQARVTAAASAAA